MPDATCCIATTIHFENMLYSNLFVLLFHCVTGPLLYTAAIALILTTAVTGSVVATSEHQQSQQFFLVKPVDVEVVEGDVAELRQVTHNVPTNLYVYDKR